MQNDKLGLRLNCDFAREADMSATVNDDQHPYKIVLVSLIHPLLLLHRYFQILCLGKNFHFLFLGQSIRDKEKDYKRFRISHRLLGNNSWKNCLYQ